MSSQTSAMPNIKGDDAQDALAPDLLSMTNRIDDIARREDDWDDYGSLKPPEKCVQNAKRFITTFFSAITDTKANLNWHMPFITSDEDGYIDFAWHHGKHELHVLTEPTTITKITVWGTNIDNEMDAGDFNASNYIQTWRWLTNDEHNNTK